MKLFYPLTLRELRTLYKYSGFCADSDFPYSLHKEIQQALEHREKKNTQIEVQDGNK